MKWYGLQNSSLSIIKHKKHLQSQKVKLLRSNINQRFNLSFFYLSFYLPSSWNILIFKSSTANPSKYFIYIYSFSYYFFIKYPINQIFYCISSRTLQIFNFYYHHAFTLFNNTLRWIFHSFYLNFFIKLKFKGKGYYIFKNKRNTVTFRFGYSHRVYLYAYFVLIKFLSKTTVFVFGLNRFDILSTGHSLVNIRPLNIFTSKGVRFARQIIYKKIGKVGSYR